MAADVYDLVVIVSISKGRSQIQIVPDAPMGIAMRQFKQEPRYLPFDTHCCLNPSSKIYQLVW